VFGLMTSPVGSLSSVTFTDEVTVTSERLPLPAQRERNSRADWPELRDDRLKGEIFQLGVKIAPLKTRRPHRVAHIAWLQTPQTRRPGKYCVYRSHTRLYVDFSWDSVARKNSFAFGVNTPSGVTPLCHFHASVRHFRYLLKRLLTISHTHTHTHTQTAVHTWLQASHLFILSPPHLFIPFRHVSFTPLS